MPRLLFLPLLLVAIVTGCATPQLQPITEESHQLWAQRQQTLHQFNHWSLRGRVALFIDDRVYNLGLGWKRDQDQHVLNLEAAMGQGVIHLEKNPGHAQMSTPEGETHYGNNAQQLLQQTTQLTIPVEGLETWIKGLAHEQSPYLPDIDASGRVVTLSQDGWKINYFDYQTQTLNNGATLELPSKLYLKRANLALKIVIDQWQDAQNPEISPLFADFPN